MNEHHFKITDQVIFKCLIFLAKDLSKVIFPVLLLRSITFKKLRVKKYIWDPYAKEMILSGAQGSPSKTLSQHNYHPQICGQVIVSVRYVCLSIYLCVCVCVCLCLCFCVGLFRLQLLNYYSYELHF